MCLLLFPSWRYPIYRIPTGPTLQNLDACFLTYHSLSTPAGGKSFIPFLLYFCSIHRQNGPVVRSWSCWPSIVQAFAVSRTDWPQQHGTTISRGIVGTGTSAKLPLSTFGLASYKFQVPFWFPDGVNECQKVNSLLRAADNWLRLLQVNHPDYSFFVSHNSYRRWSPSYFLLSITSRYARTSWSLGIAKLDLEVALFMQYKLLYFY